MKVTELISPCWTLAHVDHIIAYGEMHYSLTNIDVEHVRSQRNDVKYGKFIALSSNAKHYAILVEEKRVGLISLNDEIDESNELHVCIYSSYQRKGYGKHALTLFLSCANLPRRIDALISNTNPERSYVISLLESCGFNEIEGDVWQWEQLQPKKKI